MFSRPSVFLAGLAAMAVSSSCASCLDQPAQPVVLRVVNKLAWPIYVQDEFDQAGVTVMRDASGGWTEAHEWATCACEECSEVCTGCTCPEVEGWARRIPAGGTVERTWTGEYRAEDKIRCYGGGYEPCLGKRKAAQAGTFRLKLCWATTLPNAPDLERFRATFPNENRLTCVIKSFELPASGPVEIETDAPPGCATKDDCKGGEACLSGQCSSTCLPHSVPALTGEWGLEIGTPDDAGFFMVQPLWNGALRYSGTGKVTNVRYNAGTTNLTVTRVANGLDYTVSLYYLLPGRRALPLLVGDSVTLTYVDYLSGARKRARGLRIEVEGKAALIADNGFWGPVLPPDLLAPFAVDPSGEVFACEVGDCGRRNFARSRLGYAGTSALVEAGKAVEVTVGDDTWEYVSVANYTDEVSDCGVSPMTPFALIWQRPTP